MIQRWMTPRRWIFLLRHRYNPCPGDIKSPPPSGCVDARGKQIVYCFPSSPSFGRQILRFPSLIDSSPPIRLDIFEPLPFSPSNTNPSRPPDPSIPTISPASDLRRLLVAVSRQPWWPTMAPRPRSRLPEDSRAAPSPPVLPRYESRSLWFPPLLLLDPLNQLSRTSISSLSPLFLFPHSESNRLRLDYYATCKWIAIFVMHLRTRLCMIITGPLALLRCFCYTVIYWSSSTLIGWRSPFLLKKRG